MKVILLTKTLKIRKPYQFKKHFSFTVYLMDETGTSQLHHWTARLAMSFLHNQCFRI
jgi:hypothetical protein